MNPTAFERRRIRPGFVALPHRTRQYASVASPCRMRRIDALGAGRIHELKHSGGSPCGPDISSSAS